MWYALAVFVGFLIGALWSGLRGASSTEWKRPVHIHSIEEQPLRLDMQMCAQSLITATSLQALTGGTRAQKRRIVTDMQKECERLLYDADKFMEAIDDE